MRYKVLTHAKAKSYGRGKYADGHGLWLVKYHKGRGRWFLRIVVSGRRGEMGLGSWPEVSIAEARDRTLRARKQVRYGIDPIEARAKLKYQPNQRMSFKDAIQSCFDARQAELKGGGKASRWLSALNLHVIPKIGQRAIEDLDQHMITSVLGPIWHEKPEAARKALSRLNQTLQHAAALGLDVELRNLIKRIGKENPLWGALRIHGELLLRGYKVSQTTVATSMMKRISGV